ncbi:MAG TPA: wax ester/triacylglycerol synthase domain-containing protein [Solirubrobacterales bacterium]|nr:wax ester/triacylglycerol synthase domain-containing protein [Solirubrobacterales bacterium]
MRSHLGPLDAVFLELEQGDDTAHAHFGWAMVFDPLGGGRRPSLEKLREQARQRIVSISTLRRRLSSPVVGVLALPVWLPDPDFDVGELIRPAELPAPGGEAELTAWLGDHFAERLDRSRPLWETTLLEGLEGGRWALVCKVHQCLIDGISGASVMAALLDAEPEAVEDATALAEMVSSLGREEERDVLLRLRGAVGEAVGGGIDATLQPHRVASVISRSRDMAERMVREELGPPPATSLDAGGSGKRRVAPVEVPLEDVRRATRELGGELNEFVLALAAGGVRRLLAQRGEELEEVRAKVSVSLRRATESLVFGSEAAPFLLDLPVSPADPVRRYRQVVAAAEELRRPVPDAERLLEAADLPPALVQSVIARLLYAPGLSNLSIVYVPSSPIALHSLGAPLRRLIPAIPLSSGNNLAVAAANTHDRLYLGLVADPEAIPDLDVFQAGVEETLADLARVAA